MNSMTLRPTPLALALTLALGAMPARAQTAEPTSDTPGSALQRITVTATAESTDSPLKHLDKAASTGALGNKNVLDTPFSITVIDSQEIVARGAKSIGQIFVNDPSVYTPTNSASTDWWGTQIRGLGVRNMYVDDVPTLLYWGGDFPTEVIDSVTALKGLTGFMYGFGEPGGALSYRIKRPTATPETTAYLGWRNDSLWSAHVDSSHRFDNGLALRANLATEQGTAYNAAELNRTVGSLALDMAFGSSLTWHATLVHEDSRTRGEPLQLYFDAYEDAEGKLPAVTYDYDNFNVDNAFYKTRTLLASTGVDWRFAEDWELKAQFGATRKLHQSNKAFATLLNRAGDYEGFMYNFASRLDNLYTQAIVQGVLETGTIKHEIVAGLGVQRALDRSANEWYWGGDFNGNLFTEQTFRVTRQPDFSLADPISETSQHHAFVSDTLHLGPRWQLLLGARHTDYEMKDSGYQTTATSPTVALIYKPTPRTSIYGSFVEGLEAGSAITDPKYANVGDVLGATVSRQLEAGFKHSADGTDLTAAVFQIERANQMETQRSDGLYLTQDGLLNYRGVELSASRQFTRGLNLGLAAIYLDASIEKVSQSNADTEGNTPANAPRWQVVGTAAWAVPGVRGLKLQGNWRYYGETWVNDQNTLKVPDRHVLNAGFSYDFSAQGLAWTLYGNVYNLLNTKYWASGGWGAGNVGEARNAALTLAAQF
jgi:iron complex outermembrane recepter protein